MVLIKERCKLPFRKEEFEVVYHNYKCEDSGESFTTNEIDELNLNQVYNQYRVKYNLPFPIEIKQIREKYGLSASKMAEVLGFGVNSYRNYESGEVPSLSNARLIQLANDPKEFKKLVNYSNAFEGKALERISQKIDAIVQELEDTQYRVVNQKWLNRSQYIATAILNTLSAQGMGQNTLADKMGISAQQVHKWCKGSENFTFETIAKLEAVLNIELMNVVGEDWNMTKKKKVVENKVVVPDNPEYNTITTAIKDSILAGEPEVHLKKNKKTK